MSEPSSQDLFTLATAIGQHNRNWHRSRVSSDAGFALRGLAALIDVCFFTVAAPVLSFFIGHLIVDIDGAPLRQTSGSWIFQIVIFIGAAAYLASEAAFGFTLGKACLNLKVIPAESSTFRHPLLMRWILRCLPLLPGMLISIAMLAWLQFQADSAFVENFARDFLLPLFLPLTTLLVMYVLSRIPRGIARRAWYDCAAGTRVVRRRHFRSARGFEPIISEQQSSAQPE